MIMMAPSASSILLFLLAGGILYAAYKISTLVFHYSPLNALPGPPNPSVLFGHLRDISDPSPPTHLFEEWIADYGHVVRYTGLFSLPRLLTSDLSALNAILSRTDTFQKPPQAQRFLGAILGPGVLVAEGSAHRAQRRILNPAFGPAQLRALTGIFLDKANELRDVCAKHVAASSGTPVDMLALLSSATIDIIGLAGFGYDFAALSRPADDPSELMQAFNAGFTRGFTLWTAAQVLVPALAHVPTPGNLAVNRARATMDRIGRELVTERKQALARADAAEKAGAAGEAQRDVLSLLLRANAAAEAGQRLGDADVRAQIPTFLLAGHETTSTGATWALYSLAQQPALLAELRQEIRSLPLPTDASGNEPLDQDTLAELDQLPLLDAVVRETLRLYSPVPNALRQAMHDTVIPLAAPFTDRHGVQHNEIRLAKGDLVPVPILMINRSKELWGPDAHEWKPARWLKHGRSGAVPEAARSVPGIWGHVLTFIGGPKACIGFKFSLIELKLLLHALLGTFSLELAIPAERIGVKVEITMRPMDKEQPTLGGQLPIILRAVGDE